MQTNKEQTTTTAEEKGAKFLQWVADNEREMRHALKKNCTFDPDIFDDWKIQSGLTPCAKS